MSSISPAYTDVVELCALLQCLGFSVKSLETNDGNVSTDAGTKTVVINCQPFIFLVPMRHLALLDSPSLVLRDGWWPPTPQVLFFTAIGADRCASCISSSGLNVVLESSGVSCSCPDTTKQQNSGVWQVSGVTGGKQLDKEFGCTILGSLPKAHRDRLSTELWEMIKCIRQNSESDIDKQKETALNKSASMVELSTPEKKIHKLQVDTPTRYRSLDSLTRANEGNQPLPEPGPLHRQVIDDDNNDNKKTMCRRQSTYTVSSTPGSVRLKNKTSSPIKSQSTVLDSLIAAEKSAEELRNKLSYIIRDFAGDDKNNSSISSLVLDVSKISVLKGETSKAQFASSPNLSGLGTVQEDFLRSHLKRFESASTSNLTSKLTPNRDTKQGKLRRLSPNFFKLKKDSPSGKAGDKGSDKKTSKISSIFKAKVATPVQVSRGIPESSPHLSASKRKFSHVKSTIPRLTKKE